MSTRQHKKSILRPLILPLIALGFSGYFAWHGWHGSFGIEARRALDREEAKLNATMAEVQAEKAEIERRVSLLRAQSLESDMLDERARDILGYVKPGEVVVYKAGLVAAINKK
ncbi:FtsB family cell division protein [Prosthecomicrobium sp. N25]|uniref:FtsB family cell division protein n=1 Tax=Prosthecomicrobium sp. N25 TaxID=3129254 RepID=UPI00307842B0